MQKFTRNTFHLANLISNFKFETCKSHELNTRKISNRAVEKAALR